jgi:two-component system, cell cycle response regulator
MTTPNAALRILIVDDDPVSLAILQDHLASLGHDVFCADSATRAMYTLEHSPIHIIIADWIMPDVSGIDLCKWVRSRALPRSPHFVILTVLSDKDRLIEAFEAGADDFLCKPFDESELLARLRAWTRLVSLQQDLSDRNEYAAKITSELVQLNQKLADLAAHDDLTGLPNRRQAMRHLADHSALSARYGHPLTVALLDIDHFKQFNDTFGHSAGDEILKTVAGTLKDSTRASDSVSRIAGDEFLILLPHQRLSAAQEWSQRFREALAGRKHSLRGAEISLTVSIGLAERTATLSTPEELLEAADRALYGAKHAGRDTAHTFSPA